MSDSRRILAATLVLAAALIALFPARLLAHPELRRSEPGNGAHLGVAPRQILLEFSEGVELATFRLVMRLPSGDSLVLSASRPAGNARRMVTAAVEAAMGAGAYRVEWSGIGTDGHPTRGSIAFVVDLPMVSSDSMRAATPAAASDTAEPPAGATALPRAPPSPPPDIVRSPSYTAVRFLTYVGLLAGLGAVAMLMIVLPRALGDAAKHASNQVEIAGTSDPSGPADGGIADRVRRAGRLGALVLLLAALARLLLQTSMVAVGPSGATMDLATRLLTQTTWGRAWLLQVASALLLWSALRASRARVGRRSSAALVGCIGVAVSASLSGHPVAARDGPWIAVVLDAVHVLAAGGWMGALLILTLAAVPGVAALDSSRRGSMVAAMFRAFSPMALTCGTVLALTGAAGAWIQLGGIGPLFSSGYGRTLLIKIAAVAAVAVVGAYNWRSVLPRLEADRGTTNVRRSAFVELSLAGLVLIVTAVLTGTSPPMSGR